MSYNFLESKGIEVLASDTVIFDAKGNESNSMTPMALSPQLRVLTNYITKDSDRYYAWVQVEKKASLPADATYELYPASYDVVSINWDSKKFNYVSSGTSNSANMWLADADNRNSGTILFNIYDNLEGGGDAWTVSAYAKLSAKTTGQTTTAAKYTHTYDTTQKSEQYSGTASWTWGSPLEIGVNYTVTTTDVEKNWTKAATASVTLSK